MMKAAFALAGAASGLAASAVLATGLTQAGNVDVPAVAFSRGEGAAIITLFADWNLLTLLFTVAGLALLLATRLRRGLARAAAVAAALTQGAACATLMYHSLQVTGSPFAFNLWFPLAVAALLAFYAAWSAGRPAVASAEQSPGLRS